ncbi:MAG: sigma-70 family RNA polymerase sigma factor [Kiritimatiellae bacterium]|nr:sigma-70 family RNA polymerase sigma factor [Kiritimatiellia bacterium]
MEELKSLIKRTRSGDLEAFTQIVQRFQDMAYGYAYSKLGDFHLAQDVTQEAFMEVYWQLPKLRVPEAFISWFRKIIFKHCDRISRANHIHPISLDAETQEDEMTMVENTSESVQTIRDRNIQEKVMEAIRSLTESQRMVTTLFYINGYSLNEVAEFLEVPMTTVKKRLYDSRKQLKERMMDMVATTLKNNVLPKDFAQRLLMFPFPKHKPEINIVDCPDDSFEVRCVDAQSYFVPFVENGRCDWTFYDNPDGCLTGVYECKVIDTAKWKNGKLVRVWTRFNDFKENGKQDWNEAYYTVENDMFRRVEVKKDKEGKALLSDYFWSGDGSLAKPASVKLKIGASKKGCELNEVVGVSKVTIQGRAYKCLKVVWTGHQSRSSSRIPTVYAEWYVAKNGRTILFRRYNGKEYTKPEKTGSFESLSGNSEVIYKGVSFRHWYDCIPDIIFEE